MSGDPKLDASQVLPDFDYAGYARLLGLHGVRVDAPGGRRPRLGRGARRRPPGAARGHHRPGGAAAAAAHPLRAGQGDGEGAARARPGGEGDGHAVAEGQARGVHQPVASGLVVRIPLVRQLQGDPLALRAGRPLGALGAAEAADRRRRPRRQVDLPVLRRRLRPERLRQGRAGHPDRGRPGLADLARPAVPEGLGLASSSCTQPARARPKVKYRRPYAHEWEELDLETAMDMIADRVIETRARHVGGHRRRRQPLRRTLGHRAPRRRHARQRGELPDQEALHGAGRAAGREPGPHMTLLHGPRSGDLVRARRRHHVPAGPAELRLHRDHGLQHGREPPGRLPVGDGGQARAAPRSSTSTRASRARARWPTCTCRSAPAPTSPSSAGSINYILAERALLPRVRPRTTRTRRRSSARTSATPRTSTASSPAGIPRRRPMTPRSWEYEGTSTARRGRDARAGAARSGRQAHGAHGGELEQGEPPGSTRRSSTRAASSRSSSGTSRATRPSSSSGTCGIAAGAVPRASRGAVRELRPRAHFGLLLRGRLDPAHGRRPVHPRRLDHPAPARQHRPPGRRHPRAPRPRVDPGLDRHPDALRHPAGLPADAARARAHEPRRLHRAATRRRPGFWGNAREYMVSLLKA